MDIKTAITITRRTSKLTVEKCIFSAVGGIRSMWCPAQGRSSGEYLNNLVLKCDFYVRDLK